jgi:hypothetical protein
MSAKDDFLAVLKNHLEKAEAMCDVARVDPEVVATIDGERMNELATTVKVARELADKL